MIETVVHVPPELGQPRQRLGLPSLPNLTHNALPRLLS
jgi:hypothetical protein